MKISRAAAPFLAAALLSAGLPGPAGAATLELPADAGAPPGGTTVVSVQVDDASGMLGTDLVITYDPAVATATAVSVSGLSSGHTLFYNLDPPGVIRVALYGTTSLSGAGALIDISFTSTGTLGSGTSLHFALADLNEGGVPATLVDGRYCVAGLTEEVANLSVAHAPAWPVAALSWDGDPFAEAYNVYRGASRDLGDLACFQSGVGATTTEDDGAVPAPGASLLYLVTAINCRGESGLGYGSGGAPRPAPPACP